MRCLLVLLGFIFLSNGFLQKMEEYPLGPWHYDWNHFALWTPEETYYGDEPAYVHAKMSFHMNEQGKGKVYFILFPSSQRYKVDTMVSYLVTHGGCPAASELTDTVDLSHPSILEAEYPYDYTASNFTEATTIDKKFYIKESAEWYLYLFNCQSLTRANSRGIIINGVVEWMNPYGHLDADTAPLLPFSFCMMIMWILVCLVWAVLLLRFRADLLFLQKFVCLVLCIALAESICYVFELYNLNFYGEVGYFLPFFRASLGALKNSLGQVCLYLISVGLGIVCLEISTLAKIYVAVGCFGLCSCSMVYVTFRLLETDFYISILTTLTLEVIQLPTLFFYVLSVGWSLICIHTSMARLRNHKEFDKIQKFHVMAAVTAISTILGLGVMIMHGVATLFTSIDHWWAVWWMWDAYWLLQFFVATVIFLYLWRPKHNNVEYHISEELRQEEERARRIVDTETNEELQRELRNRLRETLQNRQQSVLRGPSESSESEVALTSKLARMDESSDELQPYSESEGSEDENLAIALREIPFEDSYSSSSMSA